MRHHTEEVLHAWDYETPEPISSPCHSFADYFEAAAQPGAWAGDVELVALGKVFPSHPILVLSPGGTPVVFGDRTLPLPRLENRIALWLQGGHFELLSQPVPEWIWSALWEDSCPPANPSPLDSCQQALERATVAPPPPAREDHGVRHDREDNHGGTKEVDPHASHEGSPTKMFHGDRQGSWDLSHEQPSHPETLMVGLHSGTAGGWFSSTPPRQWPRNPIKRTRSEASSVQVGSKGPHPGLQAKSRINDRVSNQSGWVPSAPPYVSKIQGTDPGRAFIPAPAPPSHSQTTTPHRARRPTFLLATQPPLHNWMRSLCPSCTPRHADDTYLANAHVASGSWTQIRMGLRQQTTSWDALHAPTYALAGLHCVTGR